VEEPAAGASPGAEDGAIEIDDDFDLDAASDDDLFDLMDRELRSS
jgi:hypothetical protein